MAVLTFDQGRLARQLALLPAKHRVAFAAACSERLIPNYEAFALMERWGDSSALDRALDAAWGYLDDTPLPETLVRELIAASEAVAPDTEEFDSLFTSAALDAAGAVIATLMCCLNGEVSEAVRAASAARDTIDMYIQQDEVLDATNPNFEQRILAHPLMIEELSRQQQDMERLRTVGVFSATFLTDLRRTSRSAGLQPITRGLMPPAGDNIGQA